MPDLNGFLQSGHPMSLAHLRRAMGKGPLYNFLRMFATRDVVHDLDDFVDDTINLDKYAVANGGGAGVASFAISVAEDGIIRGTTGTGNGDTASASLIGPAIHYGDRNDWVEFRWRPTTLIAETIIELGFVDVVPGSTKPVVNSIATPSVNTSVVDAAIYRYTNASAVVTNGLYTIGTTITAAKATFTPVTARAAGTYVTTRIQLTTNHVRLWDDGVLVAQLKTPGTDYIEGGNPLAHWAYVRASDANSKSLDIDYIEWGKDRN